MAGLSARSNFTYMGLINGLHHITALAGDAQENVTFYTEVLGLRMVKKTINFDSPDVYHLYYGDEGGSPGTILTFFPYGKELPAGRKGAGQATFTAFSIAKNSLEFWCKRLDNLKISYKGPASRFGEEYIVLEDHDGLGIELIESDDARKGWANHPEIPANHTIKGFHSITCAVSSYEKTEALLTQILDYKKTEESADRIRYEAGKGGAGTYIDLYHNPVMDRALQGNGTVHHIAFSTDNDDTQLKVREKLFHAGYQVTQVLDRQYFHSIYFREPNQILFEIATNNPGFAIDETKEKLGAELKLPAWQEKNRSQIERGLLPVSIPNYNSLS